MAVLKEAGTPASSWGIDAGAAKVGSEAAAPRPRAARAESIAPPIKVEVEDEDEAAEVAAEFKGAEANAEFENFETLRLFTGATLRATEAVFVAAVAWEKKLRFAAVRAEISDARRTMEIIYWTRERVLTNGVPF